MDERKIVGGIFLLILAVVASWAQGREPARLKFATAVRAPSYDMPMLAAQEQGLWQRNGLQVEWIPFTGGRAAYQAMAAQSVEMAMSDAVSFLLAAHAGVPTIMVADPQTSDYWQIWVKGDSPLKAPRDLKAARIGTLRAGGAAHAFARALIKGAGLDEKDVKFVATGGGPERVAALKAGVVQAYVAATLSEMPLKAKGEIRSLISLRDVVPREWPTHVLSSHKALVSNNPDVVKRAVKAFLQATDFVQENQAWTIEKLKAISKYPEEAAKETFALMKYGKDGRINKKALENIQAFLIEYGLLAKGRALPVQALYTEEFTR